MGKKIASVLGVFVILLIAAAVYIINPFEKKIPGALQVIIEKTTASLFLDDQYLDKSPYINRYISPGKYNLIITPDDSSLAATTLPLSINKGVLTVVYWTPGKTKEESGGLVYELEPIENKSTGEVEVKTTPANAILNFGNQPQQFAPFIFKDIEPGHHTLQIILPAFNFPEQKVNVPAGYKLIITAKLIQLSTPDSQEQISAENELEQIPEENIDPDTNSLLVLSTKYYQQDKEVLRVREDSSAASSPVGFVEVDKKYTYLEEKNSWYLISFADAFDQKIKQGWVTGQFIQLDDDLESE